MSVPSRPEPHATRFSARQKELGTRPIYAKQKPQVHVDQTATDQQLVGDMNEAAGKTASTRKSHLNSTNNASSKTSRHKRKRSQTKDEERRAKSQKINQSLAGLSQRKVNGRLQRVNKTTDKYSSVGVREGARLWSPGADEEERSLQGRRPNSKQTTNPSPFSPLDNQEVISKDGADVDLENHASHPQAPQPSSVETRSRGRPSNPARKSGLPRSRVTAQPTSIAHYEKSEHESTADDFTPEVEDNVNDTLRPLTSGIEEAIAAHGCEASWTEMFVAGDDIRLYNRAEPQSDVGKSTYRSLATALRLWKQEGTDLDASMDAIDDAMRNLRDIIPHANSRENSNRGRDLYQKIVPAFVRLLRTVVRTIKPTEDMPFQEVEPIIQTLEHAMEAAKKAMQWQPRPSSLMGGEVRLRTRNDIAGGIKDILHRYAAHYNYVAAEEEAAHAREREEQRVQAARHRERRYKEELERRLKAVRDHSRQKLQVGVQRSQRPQQAAQSVRPRFQSPDNYSIVDIDDVADDDPHGEARRKSPTWRPEEEEALLKGLERYTGLNRFRQILDEYGDDELAGRDYDDLRDHAVSILCAISHSMPNLPEWLSSVMSAR